MRNLDTAYDQGCTLLVFGTPASGKSALITRLTEIWVRTQGSLEVSVVSDNGLLKSLVRPGVSSPIGEVEIRLTPAIRRSVAAITARDVVAESLSGRIAVLELATFDWQTVHENLRLPGGRKTYAVYLSCGREVSLQRQHDRAKVGVFNAVLPPEVMDCFMEGEPPRDWLSRELDSYWEFDTSAASIDDILAAVGELGKYSARRVRHLYDSRDASRAARASLEQAGIC